MDQNILNRARKIIGLYFKAKDADDRLKEMFIEWLTNGMHTEEKEHALWMLFDETVASGTGIPETERETGQTRGSNSEKTAVYEKTK